MVVGTRPEAIKLSPVAQALREAGLDPTLILTGQHPDLDFDGFETVRLRVPGMADPRAHAHAVARAIEPLLRDRGDLLVVQGDTSSALGGALAAEATGVPLAHVEAGLRTHDPRLPWPEEEFRVAIDARADLLFAPTELSAANLRAEGVRGAIHVTGNTAIDAVLTMAADLPPQQRGREPRLLVTCHRRESWNGGICEVAAAIVALTRDGVEADVLLHPNAHVTGILRELLDGVAGVRLLPPCSHRELLIAMREAIIVLSDSGGIQEEAPALGVPLLVLRDKTERPEALATGNMLLVGTDRERICSEVRRLIGDPTALARMAQPALPYGDGRSGPRIASLIADWLDARTGQENRVVNQ